MTSNKSWLWFLLLCVGLVIVALPRFNKHDHGPVHKFTGDGEFSYTTDSGYVHDGLSPDSYNYIHITRYFSGYDDAEVFSVPFIYRPAIPFLASFLPFDAFTSLNIINLFFLLGGLYALIITMFRSGLSDNASLAGVAMFVFSFPLFYYSTIGYVDASLVGLVGIGVFLIVTRRFIWLTALVILGVLVKESILILIPVAIFYKWFYEQRSLSEVAMWAVLLLGSYILMMIGVRWWSPVMETYSWNPSFEILQFNLMRPRTYFTFIITLGVPGFLGFWSILHLWKYPDLARYWGAFVIGFLAAIGLFGYALLSAYADGRFLWLGYPFCVPLAALIIDRILLKNEALSPPLNGLYEG